MALHDTLINNDINYNDLNAGVVYPSIKVYIRLNPEFDDNIPVNLALSDEWNAGTKRMDVTEYVINVGNVSFEGENEIFSNTSGNSSVTIDIIKEIPHTDPIKDFFVENSDGNVFTLLNWSDKIYSIFHIEFSLLNDVNGSTDKTTTLFQGKLTTLTSRDNTIQLKIDDGLIEATHKQSLIGKKIFDEIIKYEDRFFITEENKKSGLTASSIFGGWVLDNVKKTKEFNLVNSPIIKPERDSKLPLIKGYIKRFDKNRVDSSKQKISTDGNFSWHDDLTEIDFSEKIGDDNELKYNRSEIDYENGILNFEVPPIREPDGFLYIDHYKTPYRYKHPAFLAEKLFENLGYENVNFEKKKLNPYHPNPLPFDEEFKNKKINKYGQISPVKHGKNYGAKVIKYCEYDGLFYYFTKGGVYRTDLNELNEKIITTQLRIVDMELILIEEDPNFLRIVVTARSYEDIKLGSDQKRINNEIFINPYCQKNTKGRLSGNDEFVLETLDPKIRKNEKYQTQLPDRDLIQKPTTYFNEWLDESTVTLHFYDFKEADGFQKDIIWLEEDTVYESTFNLTEDKGKYETPIKLFNFKYNEKVNGVIYRTEETGTEYVNIPCRIIVQRGEYGNIPQTGADVTTEEPEYDFEAEYTHYGIRDVTNTYAGEPTEYIYKIHPLWDGEVVPYTIYDLEVVDVIYKYNLTNNNGTNEGYTIIWINGFPIERYNTKITSLKRDFAWEYWADKDHSLEGEGLFIEEDQLYSSVEKINKFKKKRVLSLEDEDDYTTEHFYEIITHRPVDNVSPMSDPVSGSDDNGLFYIFGNELTNNILVSQIEDVGNATKKTKLFFMGVDRHFNDYYEKGLNTTGGEWGDNQYDTQYFCLVELNIEHDSLKNNFMKFKLHDYTYNDGDDPIAYHTFQLNFNDVIATKWNLRGYNWRFPIHSTFIGADMIVEKESQDINQIYILFNDKIIRFKHHISNNIEYEDFLPDKGSTGINNSSEYPYVQDRQFMRCTHTPNLVNYESIINKVQDSDHFFAQIKYPNFSETNPHFLNYEYMLDNYWVDRDWVEGIGFNNFERENYRDIYRSKNFESGLKETPTSLEFNWDEIIYNPQEAPYNEGSDWVNKPVRPYMYAMNYHNELLNKTIGLRVHQVYGLSKLKRDETIVDVALKDVPKFSFVAVNRDYLVRNQIGNWDGIQGTKRWKTGEDLTDRKGALYRMTFSENDDLYLPECLTKQNLNENVVSGISIMFVVDFALDNDEDWSSSSKKRGKLIPINTTLPSILHEGYYEFLDPITQQFDSIFLDKSNMGEFSNIEKYSNDPKSKINLAINKIIKTGFPLKNPSGSRQNILGGTKPDKVFNHDNRQGGKWDLFPISSWLNDLLMVFDKSGGKDTLMGQFFSPYKSQYFPFSFKEVKVVASPKFYLTTEWKSNNVRGGMLELEVADDLSWQSVQNDTPGGDIQVRLIASSIFLYNRFDHFLVSLRRDFAQKNIMNSLLPKCSKDVGDSIITEIGNWGEFLTTTEFSTLPDSFMKLNEFKSGSDVSEKYQNPHGTLLIMGSNIISGHKSSKTINIHRTKHVHYLNNNNVYKDFLSKPIICTIDGRTESHFSIGSSIGYKSLYKEARWDKGNIPDIYSKKSQFGRKYTISEKTDALMSYRLYDQENMMWCSLEDFIEPRIPIFDSTEQSIFHSLQQLSSLMDYKFGIKNGIPYFEDKENLFRTKHGTKISNNSTTQQDYLNTNEQEFEDTGFKKGSYYFLVGEIIQIDASEDVENGQVTYGELVHRSVEYSSSNVTMIDGDNLAINDSVNIYNELEEIVRVSKIGTDSHDVNIYEIQSVINEKNLIEITNYNRLYVNDYSDYTISYGDSKEYKRKLNNTKDFKKTFSLDVPQINDYDWVQYLANKIERNVNKLRFNLNMSIKFNPNITNGDYIAVYEPVHKIGRLEPGIDPHGDGTDYKRYELFKVQSVTHNLENYTSSINCYSVDVGYSSIKQG